MDDDSVQAVLVFSVPAVQFFGEFLATELCFWTRFTVMGVLVGQLALNPAVEDFDLRKAQ
ncbi:hypothetical protein IWX63_003223 [Arthrobacter sp. CAN_A2]|uniref:hypothetical protein n=1 Tax=Arthrobacter sp. CAN_A2 TaxID=2787718 RepID=UPI0018EF87FE